MDNIFQAVCISEELVVLDVVVLVAVNQGNCIDVFLTDLELQGVQHLSENLGSHLEVAESISVLEEASCIKSVAADLFTEASNDIGDAITLSLCCLTTTISRVGASSANRHIVVLLKTLGGKDLVNSV